MDRKKKHRKPKFVTESPSEIILRIHQICDDADLTDLQKNQALNRIETQIQRQYGFFSQRFRELRQTIDHYRKTLQTEPESLTGVLNHDDSGRDCYEDPCFK